MKIAVAGTGYVGLSMAILLAQHNTVKAVDIIPEKVEMLNNKKSPIVDRGSRNILQPKTSIWRLQPTATAPTVTPILSSFPRRPTTTRPKITLTAVLSRASSSRSLPSIPMP